MAGTTSAVESIINSHCEALLKEMQDQHSEADVGISVALFYPGNSDVPGFFGYGAAGPNSKPTTDTVYAIGSVTKVFTASLAAYLDVTQVIDLGTTQVSSYLSNSSCTTSGVSGTYWTGSAGLTFEQLATQTSGMPDEANGPYSEQLFANESPSCAQITWWNDEQSSFSKNEGSWIYSSAGFVTLGFAVAAAAQTGYTDLLGSVITTPLSMSNTFAADNVPPNAALAQGYNSNSKAVQVTAAADLKSSATDMLAFLTALYGAMQSEASGESMTNLQQALAATASTWIEEPTFAMGLAWQIPTWSSLQVLVKDGSTDKGGCSCWAGLTRYSSSGPAIGIMLMTNQFGVLPDPTASTILKKLIALG
jgi:beta-lactamase class C